jgi:O-acetyl-ADP-ribose deacetylase (regulator of RNase III)
VSSDDYVLSMEGGVSRAIATAAGSPLILDATKSVPRNLGDVVVTTAGALKARYVFHVVTIGPPRAGGPPPELSDVVAGATTRCLSLAESLDVSSIAFPAIGTGAAFIPVETAAAGMARAICEYLQDTDRAVHVELYLRPRSPNSSDLEYVPFLEELAGRVQLLQHVASVDDGPAQPSHELPSVVNDLLNLEQERVHLEERLRDADAGEVGDLGRLLSANAVERQHEVARTRRELAPSRLFLCDAHEDEPYRSGLVDAMAGLRYEGLVQTWHDRKILAGATWEEEVDDALGDSDVVIALVSNEFLRSTYCQGVEMRAALELRRQGKLHVVPVIVSPCDWKPFFGPIQSVPSDERTIQTSPNLALAYLEVVDHLRELVKDLRGERLRDEPVDVEG